MLNTDRIYNEAGTGAPDFPAGMPTVGGDPIVESGSNSDGRWTRWADGTQHCSSFLEENLSIADSDGSIFRSDFTSTRPFPLPFTGDIPTVSPFLYEAHVGNWVGHRSTPVTPLTECGHFRAFSALSQSEIVKFGYTATGRWK